MTVSKHSERMCVRVCVYVCERTGGVRPEGGQDLPRPAAGHEGVGSDKIKGRIRMGAPEELGRMGLEGPAAQG